MKGIYCYIDSKTGLIVYIGKDSHIDRHDRHKTHLRPSRYNEQQINRVLQNNPNRYEYEIICAFDNLSDDELNYLEIKEIMKHKFLYDKNPKFNFTIGGDGLTGYRHTKETIQKLKQPKKNTDNYHKSKTDEHKLNMSKAKNKTGYYRVYKEKRASCKQGFRWRYNYYENDKKKSISSVSLKELKEKVKVKGLPWRKL